MRELIVATVGFQTSTVGLKGKGAQNQDSNALREELLTAGSVGGRAEIVQKRCSCWETP